MELSKKTVVITGGTSGIGYQIVKALSPTNRVLVIAHSSFRLDALTKEFPSIETYGADLSDPKAYDTVTDQIIKRHGHVDVLINNAAVQHTPTYLDDNFRYDSILPEINLNFTAICSLSYLFLPSLLDETQERVIVNINSGLGLIPKTTSAIYCATKAAMNSFSQSLRSQLSETNIRVMQAFLPLVDTTMTLGRGRGKISAEDAGIEIIRGIESGKEVQNIGKVKLLRVLLALTPQIAKKIMKSL